MFENVSSDNIGIKSESIILYLEKSSNTQKLNSTTKAILTGKI